MGHRTKNSAKNIFFSELSYIATLFLQFANRSFFIRFLPEEYLSLNGLFSNILSFLSLAELGIGSAINFALYKPLKEQDTDQSWPHPHRPDSPPHSRSVPPEKTGIWKRSNIRLHCHNMLIQMAHPRRQIQFPDMAHPK